MTAFGMTSYPGRQPAAAPMWRRQDPHEVDPSRRRHIEDPDEYQAGKKAGEADRPKDGGKLRLWLSRLGIATAALPALTVVPIRLLSIGALVALGLALAAKSPRSGHLGSRHKTTPPQASWGGDRSDARDTPDDEPCCKTGEPKKK